VSLSCKIVGKLHNLARAVADEETEPNFPKGEGTYSDRKVLSNFDKDGVLGLGLRAVKQKPLSSMPGETVAQSVGYDIKDSGKRLFGPLSTKPTTYLSQFILHIAAIGDIVDGTDTTHDFNFFSLVFEWPKDVRSFISCVEIILVFLFTDISASNCIVG
jgi:zinc finger FYVE domain-containing protein 26